VALAEDAEEAGKRLWKSSLALASVDFQIPFDAS
jgi:hypothetical protein